MKRFFPRRDSRSLILEPELLGTSLEWPLVDYGLLVPSFTLPDGEQILQSHLYARENLLKPTVRILALPWGPYNIEHNFLQLFSSSLTPMSVGLVAQSMHPAANGKSSPASARHDTWFSAVTVSRPQSLMP